MSKKQNTKFITPDILKGAVKGAFIKLNPRYMMKNPVMFVVEIGFFITLLLSFVPGLFGDANAGSCGSMISLSVRSYLSLFCLPTSRRPWLKAGARHRRPL